jgi:hypothetical protein
MLRNLPFHFLLTVRGYTQNALWCVLQLDRIPDAHPPLGECDYLTGGHQRPRRSLSERF